jgi:periplasmic protein TonB
MEKEAAMYADRMSLSHGPRPISFGASLAISSGMVAALIFATPGFVDKKTPTDPIKIVNYPIEKEPPPPVESKPTPDLPRVVQPVIPDPIVQPPYQPPVEMDGTNKVIDTVLPPGPGVPTGTADRAVEPAPLPPLIGAELDPRFAGSLQPEYPGPELRQGREGTVTVRVRVGIDGRVKQVEKVSATSDAFFEATKRQALGRWRFKPATRGGVPEEMWKRMSVRFKMTS